MYRPQEQHKRVPHGAGGVYVAPAVRALGGSRPPSRRPPVSRSHSLRDLHWPSLAGASEASPGSGALRARGVDRAATIRPAEAMGHPVPPSRGQQRDIRGPAATEHADGRWLVLTTRKGRCKETLEPQCRAKGTDDAPEREWGPAYYLPQELLIMIFTMIGDIWGDAFSIGAAAQVCRSWYHASQCRRVWRGCCISIWNPQFVPLLSELDLGETARSFLVLAEGPRASGYYYITRTVLENVRRFDIRRLRLRGPDCAHDPIHFKTLGREVPQLEELVLDRLDVGRYGYRAIHNHFPQLKHLIITHLSVSDLADKLRDLTSLATLTLKYCYFSRRQLNVLRGLVGLKKLHLVNCTTLSDTEAMEPLHFEVIISQESEVEADLGPRVYGGLNSDWADAVKRQVYDPYASHPPLSQASGHRHERSVVQWDMPAEWATWEPVDYDTSPFGDDDFSGSEESLTACD